MWPAHDGDALTENQDLVEALLTHRADPTFCDGVGIRRPDQCAKDRDIL